MWIHQERYLEYPLQSMSEHINRLENWLRKCRPSYLEGLNAAATLDALNSLELDHGVQFPKELREFYLWHNGQPFGSVTFSGNKTLMPLDDVAHALSVLNSLRDGGDFESADWWSSQWIPFVKDGGGNHIVVDTTQNGVVREFWKADSDREVIASSFGQWIDDRISEFEDGDWIEYRGSFIRAEDQADHNAWDKVDLVLTAAPAGGLAALKELKDGLKIDVGVGILLKGSRNPPFVLHSGEYYTTIQHKLARLTNDALTDCLAIYPEGDHTKPL